MSHYDQKEKRTLAVYLTIFILLAAGIAAVSNLTYQNYQKQFRAQVESQLGMIGSIKADELQDWRNERMADAGLFYRNENFSEQVQFFLENPQDAEARAKLLTWMEKIAVFPEYNRVFLLDTQGVERISIPATPEVVPADLVEQASASLASDQMIFLDFHRHSDEGPVRLSILAPIFEAQAGNRPLGVLVLRIDPNVYLYPFIQRWSVPSTSAETLLIRREEEDVLYLNSLRFQPDAALNLRFSLDETQLPAVKAALGQEGIVEGLDYRGVPVVADLRAVPGLPWFLVSKIDTAEVYAPLRARLWQTLLFVGALIAAGGAGLMLAWRQQRIEYYRTQADAAEAVLNSEVRYRRLFEAARDGILILDAETGVIVDVNPFLVEMLDLAQEEILGKELWELGFFKDIAANKANFLELQQKEYIRYENLPLETAHGRKFYVEFVSNVYQVDHHKVVQCNIRDITERKQAAEALQQSEKKFRDLVENAMVGVYITNVKGDILYANDMAMKIFGFNSAEEFVSSGAVVRYKNPKDRTVLIENLKHKGSIRDFEFKALIKTGETRDILLSAVLADEVLTGMVLDITERKQAENALRDSQAQVTGIFNSAMDAILTVDEEQKISIFNPSAEQMFGCPASEALGQTLDRFLPETVRKEHREYLRIFGQSNSTKRSMKTPTLALTCLRADGEAFPSEVSISQLEIGGQKFYTAIVRDITERKQAEEALREANDYLENLFNYANAPIIVWDPQFKITRFNQTFEELTGKSAAEALGKPLGILFPPAQIKASMKHIRKTLTGERWEVVEIDIQHVDGSIRTVLWNSATLFSSDGKTPLATIAQGQDITERKRAEQQLANYTEKLEEMVDKRTLELRNIQEQLVRQERLATLGQLAGSIGHELRNPLGVISNAVYFLKMSLPDAKNIIKEYLDIIENEARTSDKIVTDLLDFTRIKSLDRQPVAVSELIHQTLERYPAPPSVEVTLEIAPDLPPVYADPQHILQVLGNLTVNARQSMENVGKLIISAAAQSDMISIAVQDTGMGIPPENMKKLFEPLFTTKTKGIGLGLAVSWKLAEANGGRIEVQSEPGKGSTFTLVLPVYKELK